MANCHKHAFCELNRCMLRKRNVRISMKASNNQIRCLPRIDIWNHSCVTQFRENRCWSSSFHLATHTKCIIGLIRILWYFSLIKSNVECIERVLEENLYFLSKSVFSHFRHTVFTNVCLERCFLFMQTYDLHTAHHDFMMCSVLVFYDE